VRLRGNAWLPLGVEIGDDDLSLVGIAASVDGLTVKAAATSMLSGAAGGDREGRTIDALRALVQTLPTKERRCILGIPSEDVRVRLLRLPPKTRHSEAGRAAALEAETSVAWPASERLIALDPLSGIDDGMLLSIGRVRAIERRVAIAKAAGLEPVAVDVPICAWQRAARECNALFDLRHERAEFFVFGDPVGCSDQLAPRLSDERLAALARSSLIQARRDGLVDVERIVTIGPRERCLPIERQLAADGYTIGPLTVGEHESPSWAFAYGLAGWSILPRGQAA
jgi:hypothetical protein